MTVLDNLTLPRIRERSGRWRLPRDWQRDELQWVVDSLGVVPRRGDLPVAALSGGNQQKLLIGKWLVAAPAVLVLHEPTQAVDVGARRDILRTLRAAAAAGAAVLVVSIDTEDLASVCDRVIVLEDGVAARELIAPADLRSDPRRGLPPRDHRTGEPPMSTPATDSAGLRQAAYEPGAAELAAPSSSVRSPAWATSRGVTPSSCSGWRWRASSRSSAWRCCAPSASGSSTSPSPRSWA